MKNHISNLRMILATCIMLISMTGSGAYLVNIPFTIEQPDGLKVSCYISGDEYYTYLHDASGYTIIKDHQTGYYVYATLSGEELVPSEYVVGHTEVSKTGIPPGINIPASRWEQLRSEFWKNAPDKSRLPGYQSFQPEAAATLNNIVVFIRFSDQSAFPKYFTYYYEMFNSGTPGISSMRNYFMEASYAALNINSSFYPNPNGSMVLCYQDNHPSAYYKPHDAITNPAGYTDPERAVREHTLLANATNYIASQVPSNLDIDYNEDGYVDNVCYVIRGGTTAWATLLWPHRWTLFSNSVYLQGNKRVYDYNFQLEEFLDSHSVGVLAHEMFHTLGSPDLYHYTGNGIDPVGTWDLMCSTTNPPQHMSAYMKYKYGGWISNIPTLSTPGVYTLNPLTSATGNCYRINSPVSASEYFVVEFRKKTGVFESQLPGSGLVIYRINTNATGNAGGPPDEVYVFRHDGSPSSSGWVSEANFSIETGRTSFTNQTNPYCFLSNGNYGNIYLMQISSSSGPVMTFTYGIGVNAKFTVSNRKACEHEPISFSDQSTGAPVSWYWDFGDGTSSTIQNPVHSYINPGNYTVKLTVTNSFSTSTIVKTKHITVKLNPASVNISANPSTQLCQNIPVTFTATTVNAGNSPVYQWKINGNNTGSSQSSYTYMPSDGDHVQCILTNTHDCPLSVNPSNTLTMSLMSGSPASTPVFIAGQALVCRNQGGIIFAVSPKTYVSSYYWCISPGATITSGQGTSSVTVSISSSANSGYISVCGVNNCGNGAAATFNYTVVTSKPVRPGNISGLVNVPPLTNQLYSISPVPKATSYTWTNPANTIILGGQGTTAITLAFGPGWSGGILKVRAENCAGVSADKTLTLKLSSKNPGLTEELTETEAIEGELEWTDQIRHANDLVIYPNPASGNLDLLFQAEDAGMIRMNVYSLLGSSLMSGEYPQSVGLNRINLNIMTLPSGAYMIILQDPRGRVFRGKFLVEP